MSKAKSRPCRHPSTALVKTNLKVEWFYCKKCSGIAFPTKPRD